MKSRFLMYSAAIALFTALAIPLRLAAQNNQDHNNGNKHHHYVLIDMGTFGSPAHQREERIRAIHGAAHHDPQAHASQAATS